jgi:hypothetical protein
MSDMVYTLKPVKVCIEDDDNIFDAYLVGYDKRGFCEKNSGGYEHPHFSKREALKVMRVFNKLADEGYSDGTRYFYDSQTDIFIEDFEGTVRYVKPNVFGMYEMGFDMSWVLAENIKAA